MTHKKKLTTLHIIPGMKEGTKDILVLYADAEATAAILAGDAIEDSVFTAFHHTVSPDKSVGNVIIYLEDGIPNDIHVVEE